MKNLKLNHLSGYELFWNKFAGLKMNQYICTYKNEI